MPKKKKSGFFAKASKRLKAEFSGLADAMKTKGTFGASPEDLRKAVRRTKRIERESK